MIFLIILVIRIAILYTFIKYFIYADGCLNRIILFIVFVLYCVFNFGGAIPEKHHHTSSREKACFSNIRVLTGAVEMYNMDCPQMMNKLDMNKLVETKYLKAPIIGPEKECEYLTEGDMTGNGYIYCANHGDIERFKQKDIEARKENEKKKNLTYHITNFFSIIWSYETKLDDFFASLFDPIFKTTIGTIIGLILFALGISCKFPGIGGIINILVCISILRMFKKEDKGKEEFVVVYEDNSESDNSEQSNQSTN